MFLHHIEIQHQGADVDYENRFQRVATFTDGQKGEAIDSAKRIADGFVRMFNNLPTVSGVGEAYVEGGLSSQILGIRTSNRRIASIHIVDEWLDKE